MGPKGYWAEDQGFEEGFAGGSDPAPRSYIAPYGMETIQDGPDGEYLTDRLTDAAVTFIARRRRRPFALFLCHYGLHSPYESKPQKTSRYSNEVQTDAGHRNPAHAGMLESIDESLGRVIAALEARGIADNTLVVLTSDSGSTFRSGELPASKAAESRGYVTSNEPLRGGKGVMHEGRPRVPLILRWPRGTQAGRISDVPVISEDLVPIFGGRWGWTLQRIGFSMVRV